MAIAFHPETLQLREKGTLPVSFTEAYQTGRSAFRRGMSQSTPLVLVDCFEVWKAVETMAGAAVEAATLNPVRQFMKVAQRFAATRRLDKVAALNALIRIGQLSRNWNGYNAEPVNPPVIAAAARFILSLPSDIATTPNVVPMTKGRLQFEWHRGNRSLELEFETDAKLHYLKWDSDVGIEEEDVIPVTDTATVHALLRWFASE